MLHARNFLEIETPTLTRSTPEGARDFLVPVRLQPGTWYALPQSPQLFKQLLMVAGMERYYQIARCYRDEDFRADRQPEFTQLDIEMSFVTQDDVIELGEALVGALWRELAGHEITTPIPRLTWHDAMARYGSDKPDLRYGVELTDLTEYLRGTEFRVFAVGDRRRRLRRRRRDARRRGADPPRARRLAGLGEGARRAAGSRTCVLDAETGEPRGPVAKNLSADHLGGLADAVGAKPGDAVFFAASAQPPRGAGAARRRPAARSPPGPGWSTRTPGRSAGSSTRRCSSPPTTAGPPCTTPSPRPPTSGWTASRTAPGDALAYAYDIVCNGNEIGGGSVRIHRGDVQRRVFDLLGITPDEAEEKFGFLLEAFKYGPPPHGGIAFGWDRVTMLLSGADSIREVIAFPKTRGGFDPLTGAPTPITAQQRLEAGVDAKPKAPAGALGHRRASRRRSRRRSAGLRLSRGSLLIVGFQGYRG